LRPNLNQRVAAVVRTDRRILRGRLPPCATFNPNLNREIDMLKNKVLKGLLGASAVAAMCSALTVQGQTSTSGTGQSTTSSDQSTSGTGATGQSTTSSDQSTSGSSGTSGQTSSGSSGMAGQTSGTSGQTSGTSGQTSGTSGQTSGTSGTSGQTSSGTSGTAGATTGAPGTTGATGQTGTAPSTGAPGATTAGTVSKADQKIIVDLAQGNMAEIELAKLAQSKSQNDQVKTFAQQMIDDHTKALTEVQQLAQSKGVMLSNELDQKHKAELDKLAALSGDAFDRAYMAQAGVSDHKKMHAMLAQDEKRAKDPDVKALAARMLPTVDQHLKSAQQMQMAKGTSKGTKGATTTGGAPEKSNY
jgi:putative membrane protein